MAILMKATGLCWALFAGLAGLLALLQWVADNWPTIQTGLVEAFEPYWQVWVEAWHLLG